MVVVMVVVVVVVGSGASMAILVGSILLLLTLRRCTLALEASMVGSGVMYGLYRMLVLNRLAFDFKSHKFDFFFKILTIVLPNLSICRKGMIMRTSSYDGKNDKRLGG